jgi:hypothetical protein
MKSWRCCVASSTFGQPVYNRLFWNFTKGEGEVAYAMNYNIKDVTRTASSTRTTLAFSTRKVTATPGMTLPDRDQEPLCAAEASVLQLAVAL